MSVLVDAQDGRGFLDLETFGFVLTRRTGDLTPAGARAPSVAPPNGFGERVTGASATLAPRTITIEGTVVADTAGQFAAALRALAYQCMGGAGGATGNPVLLSFGTQGVTPAVSYRAYLDAASSFDRFDPQDAAQYGALRLVFVAPDPRALDTATTTIPLGTAAAACPVGTTRTRPVVVLDGPFTARTVTLKDGAGTTRGAFTITAPASTVLSGHTVEIDCAAETVTWVHGGVRDLKPDWLSAGDFVALDPAQATLDASALVATAAEAQGDVAGTSGVALGTAFDPVWADRFATNTTGAYILDPGLSTAYDTTIPTPAGTHTMIVTGSTAGGSMSVPLTPAFQGAQWPYAVLRYRLTSGACDLSVLYSTPGHSFSLAFLRTATLLQDGQWHTLVLDMRALTGGGDDWAGSAVLGIALFFQGTFTVDLNGLAVASAAPLNSIGRTAPSLALDAGTGHVTTARAWR